MTAFDQRADGQERIAVARFEDAGESGVDVGRKRSVLVPINELICRFGRMRIGYGIDPDKTISPRSISFL